jgi:hypothetical protein
LVANKIIYNNVSNELIELFSLISIENDSTRTRFENISFSISLSCKNFSFQIEKKLEKLLSISSNKMAAVEF